MKENLLADVTLGRLGGLEGFGPFANLDLTNITASAGAFSTIVSNLIGLMTVVAGLWFLFSFIAGAFGFSSAGGDTEKMNKATSRITSALTGLAVVVLAYALISLIGRFLGFDILNPQDVIKLLSPK